jgi:serine/threonine protein kinase/WD40 repeat protein/Tfp pilus assembly protein PilF
MADSGSGREPIEELAESFLARYRAGERPTLTEYTAGDPELADRIRELFPALVEMEEAGSEEAGQATDLVAGREQQEAAHPESLGGYRIIREIGRGGMGVVYEALQEALGRRVALKVLPPGLAGDARARARFDREARAAARLHHTNIVPVFDVGHAEGRDYYSMQMIRGQGLDLVIAEVMRLRRQAASPGQPTSIAASLVLGRFAAEDLAGTDEEGAAAGSAGPTADYSSSAPSSAVLPGQSDLASAVDDRKVYYNGVARIGQQAAAALAYAHARGVIHRDIKPSNLLLDTAGIVWVTDFGLAKTGDLGMTVTGDIIGTIRYMAPERFRGQCDGRADIYALGLTLYELLTLKPAFTSTDRMQLIERIRRNEPSSPRSLDRKVPRDLETIVLKAIDKDPRRRYQSADELEEDLQRFLADEPVLARRIWMPGRMARWVRRNPAVAALTAAVFLVMAIGTMASTWQASRARHSASIALKERNAADLARQDALAATKAALEANRESRQLLARQYVARGALLMEQGNLNEALLWYVEALRRDEADPEREAMHRLRIAATAQMCPRPVHLLPHRGPVVKVVLSPTGHRLLTVSGEPRSLSVADRRSISLSGYTTHSTEARIWDLDTGNPLTPVMVMPRAIRDARFSPNGRFVLLACPPSQGVGSQARVWDASTGQPVTPLLVNFPYYVRPAGFSPDSTRILLLGNVQGKEDGTNPQDVAAEVQVWDLTRGQLALALRPNAPVTSARYSPDGKCILTVQGPSCQLWNATTGKPLSGALSPVRPLPAFSSDGTKLFLKQRIEDESQDPEAGEDSLLVIDTASGQPDGPPRRLGRGTSLHSFSPDSGVAIVQGSWGARLIDPTTGGTVSQLWTEAAVRPSTWLFSPHFTEDGQHLLFEVGKGQATGASSLYASPYAARHWHARDGRVSSIRPKEFFATMELSPDGRKLLVRRPGTSDVNIKESVEVMDAETDAILSRAINHQEQETNGALSSESHALLTWGGTEARLWEAATGQPLTPVLPHQDVVLTGAFFRDDPRFVTASADGFVRVWDLSPVQIPTSRIRPGGFVRGFRISPDGSRLLLGSISPHRSQLGSQQLWDVNNGQALSPQLTSYSASQLAAFGEEGRVFLTAPDQGVQLWSSESGRPLGPPIQSADRLGGAVVSATGRRLAATESRAKKDGPIVESWIRLWNGTTGKSLTKPFANLNQSEGTFRRLQFSPGGDRLLVSTVRQGRELLQLWDVENLRPITPLIPRSKYVFIPDSQIMVALVDGASGQTWNLNSGQLLREIPVHGSLADRQGDRTLFVRDSLEAQVWDVVADRALSPPFKPTHGISQASLVGNGLFAATLGQPQRSTTYSVQLGRQGPSIRENLTTSELRLWDPKTGEPVVPPLPVTRGKRAVGTFADFGIQFSANGKSLVFCSDSATCDVWKLPSEDRPAEQLVELAQALSGRYVDASGATLALPRDNWLALRARYPESGSNRSDLGQYYSHHAELAEFAGLWGLEREYLDRVIALQPDVWMHYRLRARTCSDARDWPAGVRDGTRAIELGANIWNVWHNRGLAYFELGRLAEAARDLEKAVRMEGNDGRSWSALLRVRAAQKDSAGFRRACSGFIDHYRSIASPVELTWICALAPGAADLAGEPIRQIEEGSAKNPRDHLALADARSVLGAARFRLGRDQEAITTLAENKEVHGAFDWLFLAMAHQRLGHEQEARKWLERSLEWIEEFATTLDKGPRFLGPADDRLRLFRLLAEEAATLIWGPGSSARIDLVLAEKAQARNADNPVACNNLAWELVTGPEVLRDPKRALTLVERAMELTPRVSEHDNTLGVVYLRLGRYQDALRAFENSIKRQKPKYAAYNLYFMAMCHHRLGNKEKAADYFKRALLSDEQNDMTFTAGERAELRAFRAEAEKMLDPKKG